MPRRAKPTDRPVRSRRAVGTLAAALLLGGCGDGTAAAPKPVPTVAVAVPALARDAAKPGELLVRGDAAPGSHGPYELRGRYRVRFAQWSPEDPSVDFTAETPITVTLDRRPEAVEASSVRLFEASAKGGRRELRLDGRYYVDVGYGDFPYAVRFTKLR